MAVNWALGQQTTDIGQSFMQGMQQGRQMRVQRETSNALQGYIKNPDDPNVVNALAPWNPEMAMRLQGEQQSRAKEAQMLEFRRRAASGDPEALTELFARDPDAWGKLDAQSKDKAKRATAFMGQAVQQVSAVPEAERPALWASLVQQAEQGGMDIPTHYETYSPQALSAAASEAGTMDKIIKRFEPDWRFSPNGGLVNFNDPASIQQYGQWMGGQQPGPVQAPAPPQGFVIDGQGGAPSQGGATFP